MNIGETLRKWDEAKRKMEVLEEKVKKYKNIVSKEMNRKEVDRITADGFVVQRRRNTRSYLSKENVPSDIWKEYSTRLSYDAFFLSKV